MSSHFESVLAQSTARDSNVVAGCVLAAVDSSGRKLYSKAAGYCTVGPDAQPINPSSTFWVASCGKLVGAVAALQCVERGQLVLDDPVGHILPELASPVIISQAEDGSFHTRPAKKAITLRHLLTHTSGIGYDGMHPTLLAWRASRKEGPMALSGNFDAFSLPLLFEPGESWFYGGGVDWAGEMVARVNRRTLESYLQDNIFSPLGMTSTTLRFERHPDVKARLLPMTFRNPDGTLRISKKPFPDHAKNDCIGVGLYSCADDYVRLLSDVISPTPRIISHATARLLFEPQLARDSPALQTLLNSSAIWGAMAGITEAEGRINFALGGAILEADSGVMKKGTIFWGGLPNLTWFASRANGVAGFFATQLLPPGDEAAAQLSKEFSNEVWRLATVPEKSNL